MVVRLGFRRSSLGAAVLLALGSARALAVDTSSLPQPCKDTLAVMQGDKSRFGQLGKLMAGYRKASDNENFCKAAREIVTTIKQENERLEGCVGELGSAAVPQATTDQLLALKAVYKNMLDAAKDAKNDRLHCGLADQ